MKKMVENVVDFDKRCSRIISSLESERFSINVFNEICDYRVDSPIEQIFYYAFKTLIKSNNLEKSDIFEDKKGKPHFLGLEILPQYQIGTYRVDFIVFFCPRGEDKSEVIVECDSQKYHERSERERSYEKKRDRFLQSRGYKVFRFTGREIIKDSFDCAAEVIAFLTSQDLKEIRGSIIDHDDK